MMMMMMMMMIWHVVTGLKHRDFKKDTFSIVVVL